MEIKSIGQLEDQLAWLEHFNERLLATLSEFMYGEKVYVPEDVRAAVNQWRSR